MNFNRLGIDIDIAGIVHTVLIIPYFILCLIALHKNFCRIGSKLRIALMIIALPAFFLLAGRATD